MSLMLDKYLVHNKNASIYSRWIPCCHATNWCGNYPNGLRDFYIWVLWIANGKMSASFSSTVRLKYQRWMNSEGMTKCKYIHHFGKSIRCVQGRILSLLVPYNGSYKTQRFIRWTRAWLNICKQWFYGFYYRCNYLCNDNRHPSHVDSIYYATSFLGTSWLVFFK